MIRYLSETMVPVAYAMLFVDNIIMNALLASYVSFSQVCPLGVYMLATCMSLNVASRSVMIK